MYTGLKRTALHSFLSTTKTIDEEDDEECVSLFDRGVPMALHVKVDMLEPIAEDMLLELNNRQQAMDSP